VGLPAFVLSKIFTPVFYAREDMRTPMRASAASVVINIAGSLILFPLMGVVGLAIATSLAGWISALYLGQQLFARDLFRPAAATLRRIGLLVIGAALMGAALWWAGATFRYWLLDASLLIRLASILVTIAAAAVLYFGFAFATGALDRSEFTRLLRRRRKV
ncbi:MAG: lipid II flippase MurJ, partial [Hoeflea sp.]|nr:lipid II flippase MurJ [Hoeflea sp.]